MRNLLVGIFSYLIILALPANGQDLVEISQNNMPQARIQVTHEAVSPSWQLVWDEAREMVKKKELDGAVALYRELLRDRQGLIEARWELALVLMQLNKESQAILEFEHVVEARPDDVQALFILAELLSCSGQCDKAIVTYKNLVAELRLRGKGFHIARNELLNIPEEFTLVKVLENLARCLESQKRLNESITYLLKALAIEPDRKDLEFKLARGLLHLKRAKSSLSHFKKLLPQYENDPDFLANYAKALLAVGDRDKAIKIFERFVALSSDNAGEDHTGNLIWSVNELVSLYLMEGDVQSAIKVLEDLKYNHPEVLDKQLLATSGRLYFASRNYLKALETFRIFLGEEPDNKMGLLFMARVYERLQLLTPAISIYKQLLLLEPNPTITMHLVELFLETENFDQASLLITDDMRSWLQNDIKGRELLLDVYLKNGNGEGVEKLLDSKGDFFKDDDILASYVSLATSIGYTSTQMRFRLYNDALLALADQAGKREDLLQVGVKLLLGLGQQDIAEEVLRYCWSKGRSLWSIDMLIDSYLEKNKYENAVVLLEEALSIYPSSARLKLKQAHLLLNMGKVDLAGEVLFSICAGDNWKWGKEKKLLCEGYALGLAGRYEEALDLYGKIIQQSPNHLEAHRGRWINFAAYGLGQEADAEALGLEIITGIGYSDLSHNGDNEKFVPVFVTNGRLMPAPGAYLSELVRSKKLLSPKEILSSPFCEMEGEACPLLLALSYEHFANFSEAVVMWLSFLKRHETYWPGYERLARIYEDRGKVDSAKKLRYRTCHKIKHLRLFLCYGQDYSELRTISEETGPSGLWIWRKLDDIALESWEGVFCSD
ncbi:MAG: tetratricopeptide repeat protein [Deltaproteobacteria bacterium]|nr:tetratricopeptide repeat protein [Deltaproteobacteria bacterium]MBW1937423.1 tetratricopeptide repeat protein [Deltaproteobacteria bacterium]